MRKLWLLLTAGAIVASAVQANPSDMGLKFGLTPADCASGNVVRVDGFASTTRCYQPTKEIPAGSYDFDSKTSTLIPKSATVTPTAPRLGATTFRCIPQAGGGYVTMANNGKVSRVLISWRTNFFGDQFTPERRCQIVTERFNRAVSLNGGRMRNLWLKAGVLNGQNVICFVNQGSGTCNSSNLLLTLRPGNNPRQVLANMFKFGERGTGTVFESGVGNPATPDTIDLGEWERINLGVAADAPRDTGADTGF